MTTKASASLRRSTGPLAISRSRSWASCYDGISIHDVCDATSGYFDTLYDDLLNDDGTVKGLPPVTAGVDDALPANFLLIETIDLLPIHRGRRLGLIIAEHLIEVLAPDVPLVVLDTAPRRFRPHGESNAWEDPLELIDFRCSEETAMARLQAYFGKLGATR